MAIVRRRLDNELVRRSISPSRLAAQAMIAQGRVLVSGAVAQKASRLVAASEPVQVSDEPARFVSRGGEKLDAALTAFDIDVHGCRVLDAGASTGGFVDCVLQRGAAEVIAVDVGRGQIDATLRDDARVTLRERCNFRHLLASDIGGAVDVVTADLSFISLRTVMPNVSGCLYIDGEAVLLVKPQFEADKREASRGKGVVRDQRIWQRVLTEVADCAGTHGLAPVGVVMSPIQGAAGNVEFFLHCRRDRGTDAVADDIGIETAVRRAVDSFGTQSGTE